ncbi:MAG TPA: ABC transporter permease [Pseudonocardiaceae bacterium]|nr:ABC transporter permease [Pseudonocardiaceae bacterium]
MTAVGVSVPARGTMSTVLAVAQRDLLKLLRDRPRLAVNLAFPVLLIVGLGSALHSVLATASGLDAVSVAFTGVLAATLFQSTAAGMISLVEDRDTDFARVLFLAPVRRIAPIAGKILGETLVALTQAVAVTGCAIAIGVRPTFGQAARLLPVTLACCLLGGGFGLATVALLPNQRSAMQVFQFLIIPQYVLAGVLLPVRGLPRYLDVIAAGMPLRYAVTLARAAFYAGTPAYRQAVPGSAAVAAVVVVVLCVVLLLGGTVLFDHRENHR